MRVYEEDKIACLFRILRWSCASQFSSPQISFHISAGSFHFKGTGSYSFHSDSCCVNPIPIRTDLPCGCGIGPLPMMYLHTTLQYPRILESHSYYARMSLLHLFLAIRVVFSCVIIDDLQVLFRRAVGYLHL